MLSDPIRLEVFKNVFAAVAEEMGVVLRKSSYSPNIKERRDYSCALFDPTGKMIAQAAHIPVHLGSMPLSVLAAIEKFKISPTADDPQATNHGFVPGDIVVLNDPYQGGTHLPDITFVSPVFTSDENKTLKLGTSEDPILLGYVASRAHHADVGGMTPGSMPVAREIIQEGLIIPPLKLFEAGRRNRAAWDLILANVRTPEERAGDLWAQIAANIRGGIRLQEITAKYGIDQVHFFMQELLSYTESMTRHLLAKIPDGIYEFEDFLDGDGIIDKPISIAVRIMIAGDEAEVDFSESAPQQSGSVNAVYAITLSAVYYVFRCLIGLDVPNNSGCLVPIKVIAEPGSVVNALPPAPVAGGNVETSQRIVDVLLGALAKAVPDKIPAASQGTMNNITIGGWDPNKGRSFTYYETIGGGIGARIDADGPSGMHSHMTNTLNTPVEALEYAYPLQVIQYGIRENSGGFGKYCGGDGLIREIESLVESQVTLLTERRRLPPYGLSGGDPGSLGENQIIESGKEKVLRGKGTNVLKAGDRLVVKTPGGGGFGSED
ncbi:MAG: hydantoinase B/oxoprolinase family protein [Chloroflexota bacterium]|nr:MAG: hydantoinase B/oxoprolinase family protein [Chloroflexota bacterium]